jgi:DhnA family fructose-bisphosphate aldolase class Ia
VYFVWCSFFVPEDDDDNDPEKAARLLKRAARFGHHLGNDAKKKKGELTLNINNFNVSVEASTNVIVVTAIEIRWMQDQKYVIKILHTVPPSVQS